MANTARESISIEAEGAPYRLARRNSYFVICFDAMASPCELLIDTQDELLAKRLANLCVSEVRRIEQKFSRYREGNLCHQINTAQGKAVSIDEECFRLLSYAQTCFELSGGLFDLTSGILRQAWHFDGSNRLPTPAAVRSLLSKVGWEKVTFDQHHISMAPGMEIDFGGIGKEYAVSQLCQLSQQLASDCPVLVNLGGDLQVTKPRANGALWQVGIENDTRILNLRAGALATSGDRKRYLMHNGIRYGHILNPKTGWPSLHTPASITVQAPLCVQAGTLATLAMLQGAEAEAFLDSQNIHYWCTRS